MNAKPTAEFPSFLDEEAAQIAKELPKSGSLGAQKSIELLAFCRNNIRVTDAEHKKLVAPFKAQMKPFDDTRKGLKAVFEQGAQRFEARIFKLIEEGREMPAVTDNGVRFEVAKLPRLTLKDGTKRSAVPEQFLLPVDQCIDWKAVSEHIAEHGSLPWITEFDQLSLRTTLPDVFA